MPGSLLLLIIGAIILSSLLGALLRIFRVPAAGVIAGIIIGAAIGPTILGRFAPDFYEQHFIGGRDARLELDRITRLHGSHEQARAASNLPAETFSDERFAEQQQQRAQQLTWQRTQREHALPYLYIGAIIAIAFFASAALARERTSGWHGQPDRDGRADPTNTNEREDHTTTKNALARDKPSSTTPAPAEPTDWYSALSLGLWSAAFPGGIAAAALAWLDYSLEATLAAAACVGVGSFLLRRDDIHTADAAEHGGARLILAATRIAALASIAIIIYLARRSEPAHQVLHDAEAQLVMTITLITLAAAIASWLIPPRRTEGSRTPRIAQQLIDLVLIPALAAIIALRIEMYEHLAIWPIILLVVLSGDGRWLGAYLGAKLSTARRALPTMRLVLAAMSAGSAQLAFTAIALGAWLINQELAFALLLGALLMELTTNARRRIAREIEHTEAELERLGEGE